MLFYHLCESKGAVQAYSKNKAYYKVYKWRDEEGSSNKKLKKEDKKISCWHDTFSGIEKLWVQLVANQTCAILTLCAPGCDIWKPASKTAPFRTDF